MADSNDTTATTERRSERTNDRREATSLSGELLSQAKRHLDILVYDYDEVLLPPAVLTDQLSRFMHENERNEFRLLCSETRHLQEKGGSLIELARRFSSFICYATQNRQDAVRSMARDVDLMLVVGSVNSSNSNRLRELAEKQGVPAYLIDGAEDIQEGWLEGAERIGVTAGASAPESLVAGVVEQLRQQLSATVDEVGGVNENMEFALPKELRVITTG